MEKGKKSEEEDTCWFFLGILEYGIGKFPPTSLQVVCCHGESLFWFLFVTAMLWCVAYHGNGPNLFLLFCQSLASVCLAFNLPFWTHILKYRIRIHKIRGEKKTHLTCRKVFLLACGAFRPVRERVNARLGRWKHSC